MSTSDALNFLGIARRAGKTAIGDVAATQLIRSGKAKIAILCAGASRNARDRYERMAAAHGVPLLLAEPEDALSQAVGKTGTRIVAVSDAGFASRLSQMLPTLVKREDTTM